MAVARLVLVLAFACAHLAFAYWDGSKTAKDPYTEAMEMSRRAQLDPDALRKDPDMFKKMFGKLAIEQNQAKHMDETQSMATPQDRCMACHGVVLEFEKMMIERKSAATGGLGRRDQLAVADTYEQICHLDRYESMDSLDPRKRSENSRRYGGIAPPIFANACKRVVDHWSDYDEVEALLINGGPPGSMHKELREAICHNAEFGMCKGVDDEIEVRDTKDVGENLWWKGKEEKCEAEGAGKKKKKKKTAVDPVSQM